MVAIKSLGKLRLYFEIIHQCTCICGCEISEWKACQTIRNGFTFHKKRNHKVIRLWVFALHDLVEYKIVIKCVKKL